MGDFAAPKLDTVRVAMIGVGARGSGHTKRLANIEGTEIVAISDLYEDYVMRAKGFCDEAGKGERHTNIKLYHGDVNAWKKMLREVRPDMVLIATPWKDHAPMAIEAMEQGAHAFVEVPLALTNQELWDIVDASEKTA
jgi:predicted dehydrogenase